MTDRPPTATPREEEPDSQPQTSDHELEVEAGTPEASVRPRRGFFERLAALFTANRRGGHGL